MVNATDQCSLGFIEGVKNYLLPSEYYVILTTATAVLPSLVAVHLSSMQNSDKCNIIFDTVVAPVFAFATVGIANTYYAAVRVASDNWTCANKEISEKISFLKLFETISSWIC